MTTESSQKQLEAEMLMAKINDRLERDLLCTSYLTEEQCEARDDWVSWIAGFSPGEWTAQDEIWLGELKKQVVDNGLE